MGGGGFVLRKMLSRHYVSNVGWVLKIGVDCTGSDKFVEVPGCSFGPTFDHYHSPKLWAEISDGHGILSTRYAVPFCGMVVRLKQRLGTLLVLVATLLAIAGWRGSVDLSTMGFSSIFSSIRISKSSRVVNAKSTFFLQMYNWFCSCAIFFAVVLISCMIPMYNFAVVPFFLAVAQFVSHWCHFFAVVLIYCIVLTNPNRF